MILSYRDYNFSERYADYVLTTAGTNNVDISKKFTDISKKGIIGLAVIRQSKDPDITKTVGAGGECYPILNLNAFFSARIRIVSRDGAEIYNEPLETFGYDNCIHNPGHFAPLLLPNGFENNKLELQICNTASIVDNEAILLSWVIAPSKICVPTNCTTG